MLRFQHQEYLMWLLLLFVCIGIFLIYQTQRKKKIIRLGDEDLVKALMPSYSARLHQIKFIILLLALFFGIIGLANLQKSGEIEKVSLRGIDVVIALDVSNSMYAQDLQPSRLEKAKLFTDKLISQLNQNRLAFVLFAGRPYLSVPLTTDVEALKMNLGIASPDQVPTQGTVLKDALQLANESFNNKDAKHKAIVLITDGEDHDEETIAEAKKMAKEGVMICTVGIGSEEGAKIPLPNDEGFKKDREGNEIISKMNESELKKIAEAGQGLYVRLNNISQAVSAIDGRLKQIEQTNLGDSRFANFTSYFQYFLALSLIFLLLEFFLPKKRKKRSSLAFTIICALLVPQILSAQSTKDQNIYKGNELYNKGQYEQAIGQYQKASQHKQPKTARIANYNLGNALFKADKKEEALKQYDKIGASNNDIKTSAAAYHNAGNVKASEEKWQEAINYYKASLKRNAASPETKYNLAYAQKKLKQQQDQQKNKKDQKQKPDQDKKENEPKKPSDPQDKKEEPPKDKKDQGNKPEDSKPPIQPSNISKDQADKILDAIGREEQKIKDKKEKSKAGTRILDKDW